MRLQQILMLQTGGAALWVAASDDPQSTLPKATHAFRLMAEGFLSEKC